MRSASFVTVGLSLGALVVAVACASTEEVPATPDPEPTETQEPPTTIPATTTPEEEEPPPPAKTCVAKCTTDSECQSSCPTPSSGLSCCDVATGTCYTNGSGTCPVPDDGGTPPNGY